MSVTVRIPTILRSYTGGAATVTVAPAEPTLAGTLAELESQYPGIANRILDDSGALRRFVNLYVDDEDVRFEQGLQTATKDGCRVSIIPAVAGG